VKSSIASLALKNLFLILPLATLAPACSSTESLGTAGESESALTSNVDCSRQSEPAYSGGRQIGRVDVVRIGKKRVTIKTAHAFLLLQKKADEEGIDVSINSGFRTMSEQQYFYDCYRTKSCNNGNLAAKPGYSNHQSGRALDLGGERAALNRLIEREGLDWRRTVSKEPWHYEYFGPWVPGPCGSENGEEEIPIPRPRPTDRIDAGASTSPEAGNPSDSCTQDADCYAGEECLDGECVTAT